MSREGKDVADKVEIELDWEKVDSDEVKGILVNRWVLMGIFEWNLEKIVWFLNFLLGVFDSIIGWAGRYADEEVHKDLQNLAMEISNTRQHLLHWLREEGN